MEISTKKLIYLSCIMFIFVLFGIGCENNKQAEVELSSELARFTYDDNIYEETELELQTNYHLLSVKKMNEQSLLVALKDEEKQSIHLAYTDTSLKETQPLLNEAGNIITALDVSDLDDPYGEYVTSHMPIYDVDEDDNIYIIHHEVVEHEERPQVSANLMIFKYDENGDLLEKIPVEKTQQETPTPPLALIVKHGNLMIVSTTGIQIVNNRGNTVDELFVSSGAAVDAIRGIEIVMPIGLVIGAAMLNEHQIVFIQEKNSGIFLTLYDFIKKEAVWEKRMKDSFRPINLQLEDEIVFVYSRNQLIAFDLEGTDLGQVIDFNEYASGSYLSDVFQGRDALVPKYFLFENDTMYVYFSTIHSHIEQFYSYRLLDGEEKVNHLALLEQDMGNKTEIDMFIPYPENSLKQKIAEYERVNPHIKINVHAYREDHDEFNVEDYVQYINLELFTNQKEWDVLAVQLLPYREYAKLGRLADLDQIGWSEWENERNKFFHNILDAMKIDDQLMFLPSRISTTINLVDSNAAEHLSPFDYTWIDLIDVSNEMKQKNRDVITWRFMSNEYSTLMNSYQIDIVETQDDPHLQQEVLSDFLETLKVVKNPADHARSIEDIPLFTNNILFMSSFSNYIDLLGNDIELFPDAASPHSGKHTFTLQEGYAINEESEIKVESLKFITFLAEHSASSNIVLKSTFEQLLEQHGTTEQREVAILKLQEIVEHLNALLDLDFGLAHAIQTTAEQYVNGIVDLESAVKTIQEKLWLYANE